MASANSTTDHDQIKHWADSRGGKPARVKSTGDGKDPGLLRIDFEGYSGEDTLEHISWDDFFEKFDERHLALLYQDKTHDGKVSRFFKLVNRESVQPTTEPTEELTTELMQSLIELMQVDIDAVFAYQLAMEKTDDQHIRSALEKGFNDHQRHVLNLENIILGYGGEPPYIPSSFKNFKTKGLVPIPDSDDMLELMQTMETNEEITNSSYEDAMSWDLPEEISSIIEEGLEDEKRHLKFARESLSQMQAKSQHH